MGIWFHSEAERRRVATFLERYIYELTGAPFSTACACSPRVYMGVTIMAPSVAQAHVYCVCEYDECGFPHFCPTLRD